MFKKYKGQLVAVPTIAMLGMGQAMATPSFNTGAITSAIAEYVGYGVILLGAYYLGKWTLRAMGLLSPK